MKIFRSVSLVTLFLLLLSGRIIAQDIPDKPNPPRLFNDFAGLVSGDEANNLERLLVAFNDSTSTQILVMTVKSLNGYDKNDFAQRLGQKWGVGQKGKNNGIVILVKPKTASERGEVCIQTGYGLEGVLPDATCKHIVDNDMIPRFRDNDYYQGLLTGVTTVMSITKGEYSAAQYEKRHPNRADKPYGLLVPIIILMVVVFWIRMNSGGSHSVGKHVPFWTSMFLLGSMGRGHSGTWGNFQSGGGLFGGGGGGGGFGGFGGGGFGGGGAGGSW